MYINKALIIATLAVVLYNFCNAARFTNKIKNQNTITELQQNKINDYSPETFQFIHKIMKRSICPTDLREIIQHFGNNTCLRTLAQFRKYNCKDFVLGQNQMLDIINWPQARTTCNKCIGHSEKHFIKNAAASTVVRVWNRQLKIWQKIKVTVGHYCENVYVDRS